MKKIMIVDDESISLMMTNHILSTEYQTICASSGNEALSAYAAEQPDMVLSDLRMPGMSGYELQLKLQEQYNKQIPFMFMTADKDDETESKGFANGAMDFIRKPFRADVLLRRVGNILQTVEQIQGLKKAAGTDPMTGLLNKASSQKEIGVLSQNSQGVLMMIDLDSFKLVNDIYGHAMGDNILVRFAKIIQSVVRTTDIVGRMGGDEFIAFCQNVKDESVIAKKSEYINTHIVAAAKELMGDDMTIPLGASIGCAFTTEGGIAFDELYKKADKALYTVKQNGKHGFAIFHEDHTDAAEARVGTDLPSTIKILSERNPGSGALALSFEQFRLIYQFTRRLIANYKKPAWLLLISLSGDSTTDIPPALAAEEFFSVLRTSLRQSDAVSQSGKNQFMVLLLETAEADIDLVMNRIRQRWQTMEFRAYTPSYEKDEIK